MNRMSWAVGMGMLVLCLAITGCKPVVPNLVGLTQAVAGSNLAGADLVPGSVTSQCSDAAAAGLVISQNPVAGAQAASGSAVALVVSTGPCNGTVPNVAGQTQAAASTAITGAGLTVGVITQEYSSTTPSGVVISQSPPPGTPVSPGAAVALVVSRGPQSSTVPSVVGQTQSAASTAIIGAGLTVGVITQEYSSTTPSGVVISQSPAPGTSVNSGSTVALVVSGGPPPLTVPNVVGQTQSAASAAITAAGFTVGTITEEFSLAVAVGTVISQFPLSGTPGSAGSAVAFTVSRGPQAGDVQVTSLPPGDVRLEMVFVPAGTFTMGSPGMEQDRLNAEGPQHSVTLYGFWMGKYELTKRQWQAVMGTAPWSGQDWVLDEKDSPAVYISWNDAQSFLTAVNSYTGQTFRLPTEAEWEFACRAKETTRFYWGDDLTYTNIGNFSWYQGNCSGAQYAHVVGGKVANSFGLYDMSGNAREWCEDDMHMEYLGAPADGQAWVDSPRSTNRVLRGGCWAPFREDCRSAARYSDTPGNAYSTYGFRVVRTP